MPQPKIEVEGLKQLSKALREADTEARQNLRAALKDAAGVVATEAQRVARAKGLVDSGKLVRSIRAGSESAGAVVRVSANRKGYPYPAVYEYGRRGARAFLNPAAESKEREVTELVEQAVNRAIDAAGLD